MNAIKNPLTRTSIKKIKNFYDITSKKDLDLELMTRLGTDDVMTAYERAKEEFNADLKRKRQAKKQTKAKTEANQPDYIASFNGIIKENISKSNVIIDPANVKNIETYNALIKEHLKSIFNTTRESPPPATELSLTYGGAVYKITPNNLDDIDFKPFINMTQVQNAVNTTPILLYNPPKIADGMNSEYKMPNPNLCVYNEILALINNGKSQVNKKGASTLNDLVNSTIKSNQDTIFYATDYKGNLIYPNQVVEINKENIYKYGMTKEMFLNLAKHIKLNVNLYETKTDGEKFILTKEVYDANHKRIALNAIIQNNHLYVLKSIELIRKYNAYITSNSRKRVDKTSDTIIKYVCNSQNLSNIDFLLTLPHLPNKITLTNGVLSKIILTDKNPETKDDKKTKKKKDDNINDTATAYISSVNDDLQTYYGDEYRGETPQSIAHEYLMKELKSSYMNESIYKALTADNVKHRTHADVLDQSFITNNEINNDDVVKYDLNKAYKYVMENMLYNYHLNITSEITPFVGEPIEEGLYFATPSKKSIVLHKQNWYSKPILDYAREQGEQFTISYKINVLTSESVFKKVIQNIENEFNSETAKGIKKTIINSISGLVGITKTSRVECKITTSENDIYKFLKDAVNPYVKNEKGYYFYGHKKITMNRANRLIQYIQILDEFNILAHRRMIGTGGKPVARNIDAFYVYRPINTDHLSEKEGDYKIEAFKPIREHKKERHVIYNHITFKTNILPINDSSLLTEEHLQNGLMLLGMGGTGKTTAIKQIVNDAVFLSPTHTASLKIGGQTIHSYFNIGEDGQAEIKQTDKKYLVIDECSMITGDIWEHILAFKVMNPNIIIILMGDEHQLPSIEDLQYDFSTNNNILSLVNHNVVRLTKNYRQDKQGEEISNKIINGEHPQYEYDNKINHNAIHITFRNNTRILINEHINSKINGETILLNDDYLPAFTTIDGGKPIPNPYKTPIQHYGKINKGVKVICNKTDKKLNITNGQMFIIYNIDSCIYMTDNNKVDYEISREDFSKHFTLNNAITIYKAQGQTFADKIQIHDMDLMTENYKYIYTAISRATNYQNLSFSNAEYNYIDYTIKPQI